MEDEWIRGVSKLFGYEFLGSGSRLQEGETFRGEYYVRYAHGDEQRELVRDSTMSFTLRDYVAMMADQWHSERKTGPYALAAPILSLARLYDPDARAFVEKMSTGPVVAWADPATIQYVWRAQVFFSEGQLLEVMADTDEEAVKACLKRVYERFEDGSRS